MSNKKISDFSELTTPASGDFFEIVDVSDTTEAATGTNKKIQYSNISIAAATATTSGKVELATDAETITGTDTVRAVTPSNITAKMDTDGTLAGNLDTRIPSQKAVKTYVDTNGGADWKAVSGTLTYSSTDSPTFVSTTSVDLTSTLNVGKKLKYTQTQALTSYWSFDANSNDGVGSNNGTDTAMSYTAGKFSNAATFNGTTSKIVIADASSMKPTGDFTIGFWMKTATDARFIIQSQSQNTNVAGIGIVVSSNKINVQIGKNTGTVLGTDYSSIFGATTVTDNTFHYVVVTFRNNYLQIYVDGKLDGSGYCLSPAYAATNYPRIGVSNFTGTDANFFNGQIDDLYLINGYALDEATIAAKYAASTAQGTGTLTLTKYGIVTAITASTLTFYGGTDHALANATITTPYYSSMSSPLGFSRNPEKWSVILTNPVDQAQASPTQNVWYNIGTTASQITVPIGSWRLGYWVNCYSTKTATTQTDMYVTLSTANNSESESAFTSWALLGGASATLQLIVPVSRQKPVTVTSKTLYYLNAKTGQTGLLNMQFLGSSGKTVLEAVCSYL